MSLPPDVRLYYVSVSDGQEQMGGVIRVMVNGDPCSYALKNSVFDVLLMMFFGILGYLFKKYEYEPAPLILAFVLGPMLDRTFVSR